MATAADRPSPLKGLNPDWPVLKGYGQEDLSRIALPLGGIGTGTVSLGGRGELRDWEIVNRPAKGFSPAAVPAKGERSPKPCFVLFARSSGSPGVTRCLEGALPAEVYEGSHGSRAANHGLPRFEHCSFAAAYPFGQVLLRDPDVPVHVRLEAFNPLIPADAERSGMPVAVLRFVLTNRTRRWVYASVCGHVVNFIGGEDAKDNRTRFRKGKRVRGIYMDSRGVPRTDPAWGTLALATTARGGLSYQNLSASGEAPHWGEEWLAFWDTFSRDGRLEPRARAAGDVTNAFLAVSVTVPPGGTKGITFLLTWHFPNRVTWTPKHDPPRRDDVIGNYYCTRYRDAWAVAEKTAGDLKSLERDTVAFVRTFCESSLPDEVKEAALFNLSTLRTQTCFRTPDGRFYGWEGCSDSEGCCSGSATHVWNYEQATAFLFGDLALAMREVEFAHATRDDGLMSFRVPLPLDRVHEHPPRAAADGQMGCIMKMYRDWQLSGDDRTLRRLWPRVRRALEYGWIPGGWDADRDGVMEGCQHNTMDVEYYGPNPQMTGWYLGALRAAEEMARYLGETEFAAQCRALFETGRRWMDEHLFNGEYYEHHLRLPRRAGDLAEGLRIGLGARHVSRPDFQLGQGCLVDQLVGQTVAHVCGLGYLHDKRKIRKTLRSILKYNRRDDFDAHFNTMRSYAMGRERALLMASYPRGRPRRPFPYFTEVMTGFEYTAAAGMLYEGMTRQGLEVIADIRHRYDGRKRSPFDEAECGHHYARAMASWAAVLALTGFHYSGVTRTMTFAAGAGDHFWSTGYAWGTCRIRLVRGRARVALTSRGGELTLRIFRLAGAGEKTFAPALRVRAGRTREFTL